MDRQEQLDFMTRPPELGQRQLGRFYVLFVEVTTERPDPDEEWGGGFSTQVITHRHTERLCLINEKEGLHVVREAMKRYHEKYQDRSILKKMIRFQQDERITHVRIGQYLEDFNEVYEIHE